MGRLLLFVKKTTFKFCDLCKAFDNVCVCLFGCGGVLSVFSWSYISGLVVSTESVTCVCFFTCFVAGEVTR